MVKTLFCITDSKFKARTGSWHQSPRVFWSMQIIFFCHMDISDFVLLSYAYVWMWLLLAKYWFLPYCHKISCHGGSRIFGWHYIYILSMQTRSVAWSIDIHLFWKMLHSSIFFMCSHRKWDGNDDVDAILQVLLLVGALDTSHSRGCSIFSLGEHETLQAFLILLNS